MEEISLLLKISALLLTACYVLLLSGYRFHWKKIKKFSSSPEENKTFVSVIIAARNEEKNIASCLNCISLQNYPHHLFEIIIVNDYSEDSTQQIIETFISSHKEIQTKLINLSEILKEKNGSKKIALNEAIKLSKGELIITTDADCAMNSLWMKTIADYYEEHQPYLIAGPVMFSENNLYDKIQSLEFMSLIGIGASAIHANYPLMCNAANLAFKKEAYFDTGRIDVKNEPATGDDTFLMFSIYNKYKGKIAFLKSTDAMVTTSPQSSLKSFFNQRKRWGSKIKSYTNFYVQFIGLMIFLFNAGILLTGITCFTDKTFLPVFFIMLTAKLLIDFIFLFPVAGFFKKRKLLFLFLPAELLHVFYIIIISLLTFSGSYEWKKRKIKI